MTRRDGSTAAGVSGDGSDAGPVAGPATPQSAAIQELDDEVTEARAAAAAAAATERSLRQEVSQLRARIDRIESRRAWQVLRAIDTSARSPVGFLKLPWRILRALRRPTAAKLAGTKEQAKQPRTDPQGRLRAVEVPEIPTLPIPEVRPNRPDLRVAGILDTFSVDSFKHEFDLEELARDSWRQQLEARPPHLLFVESAWRGFNGKWTKALSNPAGPSDDMIELVEYCKERGIPTVFWNKEDPPNYDRFVRSAALFDHVFTVDADRLPHYHQDLGHDRVYVLPFAAQPAITNPEVVPGGREYDVAFAGTYFANKHPGRRGQMDMLLNGALDFGLHIFSRFTGDDRYAFPAPLDQHVVGSLPYEAMAAAYKRYRVFLNVNSVSTSPSTCSRRVFECLASGTPLLSTPARAFEELFGDDPPIVTVEDEVSAREQLSILLRHDELRDRLAAQGLRAVMREHTYRHRVDEMLRIVAPDVPAATEPLVSAVICTMRHDAVETIIENLERQRGVRLELVLVTHGFEIDEAEVAERLPDLENLRILAPSRDLSLGAITNLGFLEATGDIITKMDDDDYYAPNYLRDQVTAFEYSGADVVGKQSLYAYLAGRDLTLLRFPGREHREVNFVAGPTIMIRREVYDRCRFPDLPSGIDTRFLAQVRDAGLRIYSTDRFNFMYIRSADRLGHTWKTDDAVFLNNGVIAFVGFNPTHVEL